jgi:hypothetical protein
VTRLLTLAVSTLATYRLTKLVVSDEITAPLRERVFQRFGEPDQNKVSYAVTCPHCTSVYAGLVVALAHMIAPRLAEPVLNALAYSAVTGIMAEREDSF